MTGAGRGWILPRRAHELFGQPLWLLLHGRMLTVCASLRAQVTRPTATRRAHRESAVIDVDPARSRRQERRPFAELGRFREGAP